MKRVKALTIAFLALYIHSYSQDAGYMPVTPNVIPMSPNAAAITEYGKLQANSSLGLVNITIPVYEIELYGKKFPISLSYNTSGVKVSQDASWVGLGWTLSVGGCISRDIMDGDDLERGYGKDPYVFNETSLIERDNPGVLGYSIQSFSQANTAEGRIYNSWPYDIFNSRDTKPDVFHYNFGGYNGCMFFKRSEDGYATVLRPVLVDTGTYLDIQYNVNTMSWIVKDADGFKYYFGGSDSSRETTDAFTITDIDQKDSSQSVSDVDLSTEALSGVLPNITAWMLDSIVAPNREKVTFKYNTAGTVSATMSNESLRLRSVGSEYPLMSGVSYNMTNVPRQRNSYSYSNAILVQSVLEKIETPKGVINFNSSDRLDTKAANIYTHYGNMRKLSTISIISPVASSRTFSFEYDYLGNTTKPYECRLLLTKFMEKYGSDEPKEYLFNYDKGSLPKKGSRQTDIWGFYNNSSSPMRSWGGSSNAQSTIDGTSFPVMLFSHSNGKAEIRYGRNRGANADMMLHGMLTAITYPTGGATHLEYEPHQFEEVETDALFSLRTRSIGSANINHTFTHPCSTFSQNCVRLRPEATNGVPRTFVLDEDAYIHISVTGRSQLWKVSNGVYNVANLVVRNTFNNNIEYSTIVTLDFSGTYDGSLTLRLPAGNYEVQFISLNPYIQFASNSGINTNIVSFSAGITAYEGLSGANKVSNGGGLRIKKLYETDTNGDMVAYRKFSYIREDGTPSGKLLVKPKFSREYLHEFKCKNGANPNSEVPMACRAWIVTSEPILQSVPVLASSPVSYSRIVEEYGINGEYGKIVRNYTEANTFDNPSEYPGFCSVASPWNGKLEREQTFDGNGVLQKSDVYNYNREVLDQTRGWCKYPLGEGIIYRKETPEGSIWEYGHNVFSMQNVFDDYYLRSYKYELRSRTETEYYGGVGVSRKTTYSYDPVCHLPNVITTESSSGDTHEHRVEYSATSTKPFAGGMRAQGLFGNELSASLYVNGEFEHGSETDYTKYSNSNMYLPSEMRYINGGESSHTIKYNNYDSHGNLCEVSDDKTGETVYLWGYNYQFPVAEIKGVNYTEVSSALGVDMDKMLSALDINDYKQKLDALRAKLPNAQITTLTYDPLRGVKSITGPAGKTMYYDYYQSGDLRRAYDYNSEAGGGRRIHKAYRYKYKEEAK